MSWRTRRSVWGMSRKLLYWDVGPPWRGGFVGGAPPYAPRGILEIGPAAHAVPVIDHDVGDGLHAAPQQLLEHRPVLVEGAITVVQPEVFLGVVARAELPSERRRRQPDQIEASLPDGGGVLAHDLIPPLVSEARELLRMSVAIRLPVEPLEHHPIVVEARLRRREPDGGQQQRKGDREATDPGDQWHGNPLRSGRKPSLAAAARWPTRGRYLPKACCRCPRCRRRSRNGRVDRRAGRRRVPRGGGAVLQDRRRRVHDGVPMNLCPAPPHCTPSVCSRRRAGGGRPHSWIRTRGVDWSRTRISRVSAARNGRRCS